MRFQLRGGIDVPYSMWDSTNHKYVGDGKGRVWCEDDAMEAQKAVQEMNKRVGA